MTEKELTQLQKKALEQLQSGESLFGKDGAFAPMLKSFIESALQAEMDGHLDENQRGSGNKRNGKGRKTIKSAAGSFEIDTPQDRHSSFEPELIKKRQTGLDQLRLEAAMAVMWRDRKSRRLNSSHVSTAYTV